MTTTWYAADGPLRQPWYDSVRLLAPFRVPVALGGALLLAVASWLPWASFSGFPGKMTLPYPGGARAYTLILAVFGVLALLPWRGRRGAGEVAAFGALVVSVFTLLAISADGGGFVNVGIGAPLAVVGSFAMLAGFGAFEPDAEVPDLRALPSYAELVLVCGVLAATLQLVVLGLKIEQSSQFLAFLAAIVFVLAALARLGVLRWWQRASTRHRTVTLVAAIVAATVFPLTQSGNEYWVRVGANVGVLSAAAIGLNIVVGLAGLLDLGYIAFFGVGAYVGASFSGAPDSNAHVHIAFLLVVVLGALLAATFGILIGAPTLRLRGDYLAIVTLAFGEIFRIAANNLDGFAGPRLTNGPNGIPRIPNLELPKVSWLGLDRINFGDNHELFGVKLGYFANYFLAELFLLMVVVLIFVRLNNSRIGRAWVAIREDETAAAAMGVNTVRLKLLAFAIGAFLAGAAGTLQAHVGAQVSPDAYKFEDSILLLAAVVLGGMGTVGGAVLGVTMLEVLPEKLRFFNEKRILIFGIALIVMMRFRPEGVIANRRRQRELHEAGGGAGATSAPPGAPVASS